MANPLRKEVEFELDGRSYIVRPTFRKMSEIETRFGPGIPLLNRMAACNLSVTEIATLVSVMIRDQPGAPTQKELNDIVFDAGALSLLGPIGEFINNGLKTDEVVAKKEGDDTGN
jgi:hypothetical protein